MESLGIFSVVSRRDPFERKCRKSPRVEVQIMCQSSTRTDGLAVPRPYRLRCADGRDGLQQRPDHQRQTDPSLQRGRRPRAWHLHGRRVLGDKEIGLHRPAMLVGQPTFVRAQLPRRRAHQQWFVVGWVINPYHIQESGGELLIVQHGPAPQPDVSRLSSDGELLLWRDLWMVSPWMQHLTVHRRAPWFNGWLPGRAP